MAGGHDPAEVGCDQRGVVRAGADGEVTVQQDAQDTARRGAAVTHRRTGSNPWGKSVGERDLRIIASPGRGGCARVGR
ncbi:hypothetical protein GCM10010249_30250 [Streptomyces roseolilacinus]|uniref:Uncharacterized protein n=1 Tax=Streptomyces roseolilacinus TaxID=66904 RepID=A0A918EL06_9ACTN|nr:hypothetical protein GCM10010249_30250 [Streptomyces roseolilacinus]